MSVVFDLTPRLQHFSCFQCRRSLHRTSREQIILQQIVKSRTEDSAISYTLTMQALIRVRYVQFPAQQ